MPTQEIRLLNVKLSLGNPPVNLLDHSEIKLNEGINVILGPNGAGKTLTNRILSLMEEVSSGQIFWNKEIINPFPKNKIEWIRKIGYMRQEPVFVKRSVLDNLSLPLEFRNIHENERKEIIDDALEQYSLVDIGEKNVSDLSTGQRQKVALARTLITDPELIILDEPTSSLDMKTTKWFEKIILKLQNNQNKIIVWTTHDQFQVKRVADTVSILINGRILDSGPVSNVLDNQQNQMLKDYLRGELVEFV